MWRAHCQGSTALEGRWPCGRGARVSGAAYSGFRRSCKRARRVRLPGQDTGRTAMILPITLTIAGAAALLNIWLARRVGQMRLTHKVSIGDGGNEALIARMRAQANFVEYTPFVLILIGLIELAEGLAAVAVDRRRGLYPRPNRPCLRNGPAQPRPAEAADDRDRRDGPHPARPRPLCDRAALHPPRAGADHLRRRASYSSSGGTKAS